MLFRETEPPTARRYLDLGCGYGVIGLALATAVAGPSCAAWTSTSARCCWPTRTPRRSGSPTGSPRSRPTQVPADEVYDEIWSNPPIRIGKEALHDLLLTWLPRLAPDGRAVLVVGKNLGADSLQRWLGEQGWPTERLASAKGFRVLEVRRRERPSRRSGVDRRVARAVLRPRRGGRGRGADRGAARGPDAGGLALFALLYGAIWLSWVSVVLYADVARRADPGADRGLVDVPGRGDGGDRSGALRAPGQPVRGRRSCWSARRPPGASLSTGRLLVSWPLLQFGGLATPWIVAMWVPTPWKFVLWALGLAVDLVW